MTYQDILLCNSLLSSIPFTIDGKNMAAGTVTGVLLCQVAYQNKVKECDEFMQEVLKKLKKEGFDERNQRMQTMASTDKRMQEFNDWKEGDKDSDGNVKPRPIKPTEEELKEADEIRKGKAAFDAELSELDKGYIAAYNEKMKEEVQMSKKLTKDIYEDIVKFIGFIGDIEISGNNGQPLKVSREYFLRMVGLNLVTLE